MPLRSAQSPARQQQLFHHLNDIINFLIIGLVIFFMVKAINRMRRQEDATPAPTNEEKFSWTFETSFKPGDDLGVSVHVNKWTKRRDEDASYIARGIVSWTKHMFPSPDTNGESK